MGKKEKATSEKPNAGGYEQTKQNEQKKTPCTDGGLGREIEREAPVALGSLAEMLADLAKVYPGCDVNLRGSGAVCRVRLEAEVGADDAVKTACVTLIGGDV